MFEDTVNRRRTDNWEKRTPLILRYSVYPFDIFKLLCNLRDVNILLKKCEFVLFSLKKHLWAFIEKIRCRILFVIEMNFFSICRTCGNLEVKKDVVRCRFLDICFHRRLKIENNWFWKADGHADDRYWSFRYLIAAPMDCSSIFSPITWHYTIIDFCWD